MKTTRRLDSSWMRGGDCRNKTNLFFPEDNNYDEARSICRSCPSRPQCLDYAIFTRERQGMWGGRDTQERKRIRLKNNRTLPALLDEMGPTIDKMASEYMFAQDVLNAKSKMQAVLKLHR